jgi:hypothetical protein
MIKFWVALLFLLIGAAPASAGAHMHAGSQGCPYQATAVADGCAAAVAAGGLWQNPNFFTSLRQSGQTYSAIAGLGGSTAAHPPNWNVAGVDYAIGATTPVSAHLDPATATLPTGCVYHPPSTTAPFVNAYQIFNPIEFPASPFIGYGGIVICNSASTPITLANVNFGAVGGHSCTLLGLNALSIQPITITNAYFFADADCSNNLLGSVVGGFPGLIMTVPNNFMRANVTIEHSTFLGNSNNPSMCCQFPLSGGGLVAPQPGNPSFVIRIEPEGTIAANNTLTIQYNWFVGAGGNVNNNIGFLLPEAVSSFTQVGSTLTLTLAATLGLSANQQVNLTGFTPTSINGVYITQPGTGGATVVVTQATAVTAEGSAGAPTSNVIMSNNYLTDFDLRIPQGHGESGTAADVNTYQFSYNVVFGNAHAAASWDAIFNADNVPNSIVQNLVIDHNLLAANLVGGATTRNIINATAHTLASCAAFPQGSASCASGTVPGSGFTGVFVIDSIAGDSTPGDQQGMIFPGMLPNGTQISLVGLTSFSPSAFGNGVGSMWTFDCGVGSINITKWCTDLSGTNSFYFDNSTSTAEFTSFFQPFLSQYQIDFGHAKAGSVSVTNNMYDTTGTNNQGVVTAGSDTVCGVPTVFSGNFNLTSGVANNAFAATPIYGGC